MNMETLERSGPSNCYMCHKPGETAYVGHCPCSTVSLVHRFCFMEWAEKRFRKEPEARLQCYMCSTVIDEITSVTEKTKSANAGLKPPEWLWLFRTIGTISAFVCTLGVMSLAFALSIYTIWGPREIKFNVDSAAYSTVVTLVTYCAIRWYTAKYDDYDREINLDTNTFDSRRIPGRTVRVVTPRAR
jgi:hypothetical protein